MRTEVRGRVSTHRRVWFTLSSSQTKRIKLEQFENKVNAARKNAGEFLEHFAEFYVEDEDEEDDTGRSVLMKTALNIFSGLVTAKDDKSLYNANEQQRVRLLGDERDMIRKCMLMGKEM